MPLRTQPLNNNVLVEVTKEYSGVSRSDENESMKSGKLVSVSIAQYHITASSGVKLAAEFMDHTFGHLHAMIGSTVRWEEFAEGGQTFEEDGKTYALIPWWRLISVTEEQ